MIGNFCKSSKTNAELENWDENNKQTECSKFKGPWEIKTFILIYSIFP